MIEGVLIQPLKVIADQRGAVLHMLKKTDPYFEQFGEIYFSVVHPGSIKGWNRHKEMILNLAVVSGMIRLVLFDERDDSKTKGNIEEVEIGEDNYCLVKIPAKIWVAFQGLGEKPAILANCATMPHDSEEKEQVDPFSSQIPYNWQAQSA